jgi:hypothetical protein
MQNWIIFSQSEPELRELPDKMRCLRSPIDLAFACLEYHVDDAMEFVADVLEDYPKFLEQHHRQALWTIISGQWGLEILKNLDAETASLARIFVAYGQDLIEAKSLYQQPNDPHHQQVLGMQSTLAASDYAYNYTAFLHDLLKYPDVVGIDDDVALVVLDFWSNYVTTIAEESFNYVDAEQPAWLVSAKNHVFQVVAELVNKIIYPPSAVTKQWDKDSKKTFKVFRMDVRDITMEAFELLRTGLTEQFINFAVQALEAGNWFELEAGLFCLISIADALTNVDEHLERLLERPLFSTISENQDIPGIARRTAVELVSALNHFFLRNPRFLPQVLPFLLSALAQPSLAPSAAKSFASLCSECRSSLIGELDSFFQMYEQFLTYPTAEEYTKSKVLEGIAAIVQVEQSDEKQLAGVQHIFRYLTHDATRAIELTKDGGDLERGQSLALTALKCLASVGRALQASDENLIDLERAADTSTFWTHGPGSEIQSQILNFVNYLTQVFPGNDEIIETACNVLRSGFKETGPGPFVLPSSAAIDYITRSNLQTPRLTYVLETACCWVSCYKKSADFETQAQRLLHYDLGVMQALQHPRNEPEVSVGCIELIQNFVKQNASILKNEHPDVLKGTFDFSIECIKSPEVLPKRASASLWKDVFEKTGSTGSVDQATCQDITNHFGQAATYALISNICGEVDFTSLEHIITPLRKLIQYERHARTYITTALSQQSIFQHIENEPTTQDMVRKVIESMMRYAYLDTLDRILLTTG